jgi:hypothetical protein
VLSPNSANSSIVPISAFSELGVVILRRAGIARMEHAYIGPVVEFEATLYGAQSIVYVLASTPDGASSDPQGFVELPYRFYNASS